MSKKLKELYFVSSNAHKIEEVHSLVKDRCILKSLKDLNFSSEIEETKDTLKGNALQKASYIHKKYHVDCFADDTGLLVDALNGAPGVFSARYAGENASSSQNINKLLNSLGQNENRSATFMTVIALIIDNREYFFEGEVKGRITHERIGDGQFGYDPIFIPNGYDKTFAQMSKEEKNKISHRGLALKKFKKFLLA